MEYLGLQAYIIMLGHLHLLNSKVQSRSVQVVRASVVFLFIGLSWALNPKTEHEEYKDAQTNAEC